MTFQMICNGAKKGKVQISTNLIACAKYFHQLMLIDISNYEYIADNTEFKHIESEAKLCFYKDDEGSIVVEMYPPQK